MYLKFLPGQTSPLNFVLDTLIIKNTINLKKYLGFMRGTIVLNDTTKFFELRFQQNLFNVILK